LNSLRLENSWFFNLILIKWEILKQSEQHDHFHVCKCFHNYTFFTIVDIWELLNWIISGNEMTWWDRLCFSIPIMILWWKVLIICRKCNQYLIKSIEILIENKYKAPTSFKARNNRKNFNLINIIAIAISVLDIVKKWF